MQDLAQYVLENVPPSVVARSAESIFDRHLAEILRVHRIVGYVPAIKIRNLKPLAILCAVTASVRFVKFASSEKYGLYRVVTPSKVIQTFYDTMYMDADGGTKTACPANEQEMLACMSIIGDPTCRLDPSSTHYAPSSDKRQDVLDIISASRKEILWENGEAMLKSKYKNPIDHAMLAYTRDIITNVLTDLIFKQYDNNFTKTDAEVRG